MMNSRYTIFPPLLLALLLVALPMVVSWETGWLQDFGGPFAALADILKRHDWLWLSGLIERLGQVSMATGMLFALLVLIIYGILQYLGGVLDRHLLRQHVPQTIMTQVSARLLGRPSIPMPSGTEWREIHFTHGRDVLLSPLRFGLWAFPVVGFLGTVMGISGAVSRLPHVLEDKQQLNQMLDNLHTAFDTTFMGLAASIVIMVMLALIEGRWERNELEQDFARKDGITA